MNMLKGWRTLSANVMMAIPILWDVTWQVFQTSEFQALIPAEHLPFYSLVILIVNIWLRKITTTPMGRRE